MARIHSNWYLQLIIFAVMFYTAAVATQAQAKQSPDEPKTNELSPGLGSFNFDFARISRSKAEQISKLQAMGYAGMAMNVTSTDQQRDLDEYAKKAKDAGFQIYAGYIVVRLNNNSDTLYKQLDQLLPKLRQAGAKLWVIVQGDKDLDPKHVARLLAKAAEQAKREKVELVIYPHDNTFIESAEEALQYVKHIRHGNLFITLHLCHEIRAGNGDRLEEVAKKVQPYLRLATINGANTKYIDNNKDWSKTIQPLGEGDYDSVKLLRVLKAIKYDGPVILHTFGLNKARADHHKTSAQAYQRMLGELD